MYSARTRNSFSAVLQSQHSSTDTKKKKGLQMDRGEAEEWGQSFFFCFFFCPSSCFIPVVGTSAPGRCWKRRCFSTLPADTSCLPSIQHATLDGKDIKEPLFFVNTHTPHTHSHTNVLFVPVVLWMTRSFLYYDICQQQLPWWHRVGFCRLHWDPFCHQGVLLFFF